MRPSIVILAVESRTSETTLHEGGVMRFSRRSEIDDQAIVCIGLVFLLGAGGLGFASQRSAEIVGDEPEPTQQAAGKMVYAGGNGRTQDFDLYVGNADGSDITELSHNDVWDTGAVFSPDGKQIAFYSDRDGDRNLPYAERNFEIYVMNVDGTDVRRLTNNPAWDGHPSWSPSGRKIAYEACRLGGKCDIYVMNADGTGKTNLTNNDVWDYGAVWSPDSRHIVFSSQRDRDQTLPPAERGWDLYVMTAAGRNVKRLTQTQTGSSVNPDWSPDGRRIAYQRDNEIYVMNADGTGHTRLVSGANPIWSPNGREIAFLGNGPEIISADGTNRRRINTSISVRNLNVHDWSAP